MSNVLNFLDPTNQLGSFVDEVHKFGQREVLPLDAVFSERGEFPHDLWKKTGNMGLLGITAPEQYGGYDLGYLTHFVVTEILSQYSGSITLSYIAHSNLCVNQITLNGTDEQKAAFLPGLISGDLVGALAMSEDNAGSDVMGMHTTAKEVNGGYVLNGTKLWITNGGTADVMVVYAQTDAANRKLTAFLVTKDMEGFAPRQKIHKIGMNASETYELVFENCFVPKENILGEVNRGGAVLMSGLNYERLILSAGALGLAQAAFDETLRYTGERRQFGKPINANQAVAFELAQMKADINSERMAAYLVAAMIDANKNGPKHDPKMNELCAGVFLKTGQLAEDVTTRAVKLHGGNGYTREFRVGRIWNDAMLYQIGGGTENVRKIVLARGLGLNA